ncbi:MAG: hypothetical protein RIQ52_395 [Pseudomonadota bacterium]|jgi:NodT family efflux transporter outer membrane factor (OMF) lipoprotein
MRYWQLVLVAGLIAGCAVKGPDFSKPDPDVPAHWNSQDSQASLDAVSLPEMDWWKKFGDPQLPVWIDQALDRNNNIQAAVGSVYKSRAILQQIQMNWIPTVNAGAGFTAMEHQDNATTGASLGFPGAFTTGFIPNYSINILQQLRNQEQAEANVAATTAARHAIRLAIIGQVAGSYLTLREEQYRLSLQKGLVETLDAIVAKYSDAHREGLISLFTLQQYTIELNRARAEIPVIEYNIVRLGNVIHALLNENPGTLPDSIPFTSLESHSIISGNIPSEVLKNRPDILQAEETLRQANANIGVNTSFFFPTIKLTTPFGLSSSSLGNILSQGKSYWEYQGGVGMPIINLGAFGAIKAAKGQYYTDYYNYLETVRNAFAAVDSALASHQKYSESLDKLDTFYDITQKRYDNQSIRYREGLVSFPDVLAQRYALYQAAILQAQAKLSQLLSIVRLYQDMGGGYRYRDQDAPHDLGDGHRFGDLF